MGDKQQAPERITVRVKPGGNSYIADRAPKFPCDVEYVRADLAAPPSADATADRHWIDGANFGWNCGSDNNYKKLQDAVKARRRDLSEYVAEQRLAAPEHPKTEADAPEGCTLVAHDTGDVWCLTVENTKHDTVAMLAWPDSWPESQSPDELREKGFVIV